MKINTKSLLFSCLFACTLQVAVAQEAAPASNAASPDAGAVEEPKLNISGFVDAYYQYNFNKSPQPTSFTPEHNAFALGMANIVLSKDAGKVGFMADVAFGPRAEAANYGFFGSRSSDLLIKQLFVTYKPIDKLKFTLGTFGTFVGYELINSTDNLNYSTSYMFSYGPFYHTGLKAELTLADGLTAMVGAFNDTDSKFEVNGKKHIGAQLAYVKGNFKGFLNYLGGQQGPDTSFFKVNQIDFTGSYQLGKVGIGLNLTNQSRKFERVDAINWMGGALYLNYAVSDKFLLALRAESLSDSDNAILGETPKTTVSEFTLSANIKIAGGLTLIPEFRLDRSSGSNLFFDKDGKATDSTAGFLMAAVYKF
jgi:Putative beta-barrel porin-2, OmpL-like. bbp2